MNDASLFSSLLTLGYVYHRFINDYMGIADRIKIYLLFFRTTILLTLCVGFLLFALMSFTSKGLFLCLFGGFMFDIVRKNTINPDNYYFYHNLGVKKIELWISSLLIYFLLSIAILSIWTIFFK